MGGGGSKSTTTVQESELNKQQAAILKALSPMIQQYSTQQLQGLSAANPMLNQMLMQAMGQNTQASALNMAGTQNSLRQMGSQMGVAPGDPRMVRAMGSAAESGSKASLPEVQAILSTFGVNPQGMLGSMGGNPAGSTTTNPGGGWAGGLGGAGAGAYAGWQMAGGNPMGALAGAVIGGLLGSR